MWGPGVKDTIGGEGRGEESGGDVRGSNNTLYTRASILLSNGNNTKNSNCGVEEDEWAGFGSGTAGLVVRQLELRVRLDF
ncbi:hypothetical protein ACH5RR_039475 [Cinchona calisaya]|uniref:Uncharacterized protein n=1 Tax=Cinchona calisaya TaxID=153742 RepID=A0ABD2XYC5_9GENT